MVRIYCEVCNDHVEAIAEAAKDTDFPEQGIWGDVVCTKCHFVIASFKADKEGIYGLGKVQWISTKDKLPRDGQKVLHYTPDFGESGSIDVFTLGKVEAGYYDDGERGFVIGYEGLFGCDLEDVTHWMAYPDPPVT